MNTHQSSPPRLTSVAPAAQPTDGQLPAPLRRALWQQRCSILGAGSRADYLRATDNQHAQQLALAEELQRLATEAFHLAEAIESAGA